MLKKLVITAVVVVVGLAVLKGTYFAKLVKVRWNQACQAAKDSVSPEDKIQVLRDELAKLEPESRKNRAALASEIVDIEKLEKHVNDARANLAKKETFIKDLRAELKNGTALVSIGSERIPREKVEKSLTRQWEAFQQAEKSIKAQEELLKARKENLEVARQRLAAMENKREELQAKVENLELELRKVRLAQTKHDIPVDDSQLSNVLKLYDEIDTQIAKEKTAIQMEKAVFTDNVVEKAMEQKARTDKALQEMDARFNSESKMALENKN